MPKTKRPKANAATIYFVMEPLLTQAETGQEGKSVNLVEAPLYENMRPGKMIVPHLNAESIFNMNSLYSQVGGGIWNLILMVPLFNLLF